MNEKFLKEKIKEFLNVMYDDGMGNNMKIIQYFKYLTLEVLKAHEGDDLSNKWIGEVEMYIAYHAVKLGLIDGAVSPNNNYTHDYNVREYRDLIKFINEMLWNGEIKFSDFQ